MSAGQPAAFSAEEIGAPTLAAVGDDIRAIKSDLDQIVPAVVEAVKRNRYFDELQGQLRAAEAVAQACRDWPIVIGVHDAILMLRESTDGDTVVVEHLLDVLFRSGIEEFGEVGATIDPEHAEILAASGQGSELVIRDCHRPGLRIGHLPLRKPLVTVTRERTQT